MIFGSGACRWVGFGPSVAEGNRGWAAAHRELGRSNRNILRLFELRENSCSKGFFFLKQSFSNCTSVTQAEDLFEGWEKIII